MSTRKLHQPLEYMYSHSFRKIYQQNALQKDFIQNSSKKQINRIFLEYEKVTKKQKQNKTDLQKDQKKIIETKIAHDKNMFESPIKRLHTSVKKYSFSVFVKKSKKNEIQRKLKVNSVQTKIKVSNSQNKVKGTRQLNSVIRTMYDNFRKLQNTSKKSYVSKSSRNSSQNEANQNLSPQFRQTSKLDNKISLTDLPENQKTEESENLTYRTKASFINTITFGQKLQHSKQLQNFRSNQSSRGFLYSAKKSPYQSEQKQEDNCFLKIEKCNLQKKDQQFLKNTANFRDIVLKDRLQKQNKKKAAQLMRSPVLKQANDFVKYVTTTRQNKYVSQMRSVKKTKKKWFKDGEDDTSKNKIQPW